MKNSETTPRDPDCREIEPLLDDLVDVQLSERQQRAVRRHLGGCEACGERLAALHRLLGEVDALPRSIAPAKDLWPGIASHLRARRRREPAAHRPQWARQAIAALFFVALGGLLSQILLPGAASVPEGPAVAEVDEGAEFALAEADYLRAKEALWAAAYSSRLAGSPETREVVEKNLRIIAEAIRELRAALAADPGNPRLESFLLDQHRVEIDLLQRLAWTTSEI